mmetsp:Transcript_584/g.1096  ORF Transcript_584/g.1096 Transcript_584/m.1096 type:complete len:212 (-) Transcript_584:188-823(-)
MFLVALGIFTLRPSSSGLQITWHPNLDVSVKPKAKSSMSSSSSSGSSSISYWSSSSIITWHVEHAKEPSQAPSSSMSFICAISRRFFPTGACISYSSPSLSTKTTRIFSASGSSSWCWCQRTWPSKLLDGSFWFLRRTSLLGVLLLVAAEEANVLKTISELDLMEDSPDSLLLLPVTTELRRGRLGAADVDVDVDILVVAVVLLVVVVVDK